jgi:hypothetical protein
MGHSHSKNHPTPTPVSFFIGEFLQKFDLENVISTNTKDFSWEKWSRFAKFQKEKKLKSPDFYVSSSR